MSADLPLVSVVVPARDERDDITGCIEAIAAQDYPADRLEVLVVDGCSADGTPAVAARALERCHFASNAVIPNPGATTSSNLNVGLERAAGEIICRVDARTRIEPHYVRTCAEVLSDHPEIVVVGGAQVALARDGSPRAIGIARALNNRWTTGGSPYRRSAVSSESDTVYLGAFRRADLRAALGWDERLTSNQDFDLNRRLAKRGRVWFEASLRSGYLPRATYRELWRQYQRFGRAKVTYWRLTGDRPQPRQVVLLGIPLLGAVGVLLAPRWTRGALLSAGLSAAVAVEWRGATTPKGGGPLAHLHGLAAIGATGGGWWLGVLRAAWLKRLQS